MLLRGMGYGSCSVMESESTNTMKLGEYIRAAGRSVKSLGLAASIAAGLLLVSHAATATPVPVAVAVSAAPAEASAVEAPKGARFVVAPGGYTPMKPTPRKARR